MTMTTTAAAPGSGGLTALVDRYLSTWTEPDDGARSELVRSCWRPDGSLIDPPRAAHGHDGISEMMAAMQSHYPGHRFVRSSEVDAHHDSFRVAWTLTAPDGTAALRGVDVAVVAEDGRLHRVTGFFDQEPAAGGAR